jgi:raffinose/stachyose/melibiose transport system permease protein
VIEAAAMDGCTPISFFRSILLPISQTAVMTVMVVQFVWMWNDLLFSMTFISNSSLRTLQTGLMNFEGTHGQKEWGPIFAGIIISVVPTLSLYLGLNSQVMKGMTAGAVKG